MEFHMTKIAKAILYGLDAKAGRDYMEQINDLKTQIDNIDTGPEKAKSIHNVADQITELEIKKPHNKNSCKAGCSSCCHQNVDLHESEVPFFKKLINEHPEKERIIERLNEHKKLSNDDYFNFKNAHISACPFLESNKCSIYKDRPLMCRKYYVDDDPAKCSNESGVQKVAMRGFPMLEALSSAVATHDEGKFVRFCDII